ncbi:peptidase S28 [Conidiobolus coronatus NRRL 28638]|uniref:Peptidase S28 n=1 Tax=Conidiobolus coronatus (strain ATCC 28846 / CBS 209.66 / NRRL 28638) TaxID=796925 RepID=A0A137P1N5_CONC2|nr:peptidase S28 [Conidiobolus coronatus NRRL 28638]|eukprot:KXN68794.1 peptidase S28 [Conidiobolus coronatus NRRL 28638]
MKYSILLYIGLASANLYFNKFDDNLFQLNSRALNKELEPLWFNQTIDHENDYSCTFRQKYFINEKYYKPGGPAFLFVGGEGPLSSLHVQHGNIIKLAKENNGIIFGLEHRYYGDSQPFDEWTIDNLKYLSSLNGVKDVGNFVKNVINPTTNKPFENTKWITIGGSYAGSLSVWIREEYPNDIFAAYASSAPVLATQDFYKYDQVIESALGPQCANDMNSIRQYMDSLYTNTTEFNKLKADFECRDVEDNNTFLSTYTNLLSYVVQYNSQDLPPNINSICSGLVNQTEFQSKLNHIIQQTILYWKNLNFTCSSESSLDGLKQTKVNSKSNQRQWIYQCCTEFGYWQTAPKYGTSLRSQRLTVNWNYDTYCSDDIFGKKIGPAKTNFINSRFKALNSFTARTIWVNGDLDPWHALSVTNTQNSTLDRPIYLIEGGSHASDLNPDEPTDSVSLTDTRKKIRADISRWLKQS